MKLSEVLNEAAWQAHPTHRGVKVRTISKAEQEAQRAKEVERERKRQEREYRRTPEGAAERADVNLKKFRIKPLPHLDSHQIERIIKRDLGIYGHVESRLDPDKDFQIDMSTSISKRRERTGATPESVKVAARKLNLHFVYDDEQGNAGESDALTVTLYRDPLKPNILRAKHDKMD